MYNVHLHGRGTVKYYFSKEEYIFSYCFTQVSIQYSTVLYSFYTHKAEPLRLSALRLLIVKIICGSTNMALCQNFPL
jgi:hypothetical protein